MQTLVPHKFVGWMLMLLFIVAQMTLDRLGFEHNLYQYAGNPGTPLSDMNGQGDFAGFAWWFRAYWAACALLLAVLAYALWRRGIAAPLQARLTRLPQRLRGTAGGVAVAAVSLMAGARRLDLLQHQRAERLPHDARPWSARLAEYEKALLGFETVPQPRITDVRLDVDLYPDEPRAVTRGSYAIQNRTGKPLDAGARALAQAAADDAARGRGRQAAARNTPIRTTGSIASTRRWRRSRSAGSVSRRCASSAASATPATNSASSTTARSSTTPRSRRCSAWAAMACCRTAPSAANTACRPSCGPPKLEDEGARRFNGCATTATGSTPTSRSRRRPTRSPIAPGYRESETVADGRRTVRYRSDAPIQNFFSVQSARYEVAQGPLERRRAGGLLRPGARATTSSA